MSCHDVYHCLAQHCENSTASWRSVVIEIAESILRKSPHVNFSASALLAKGFSANISIQSLPGGLQSATIAPVSSPLTKLPNKIQVQQSAT